MYYWILDDCMIQSFTTKYVRKELYMFNVIDIQQLLRIGFLTEFAKEIQHFKNRNHMP